jgi:membrane protease YdiL (CAAX protease family)
MMALRRWLQNHRIVSALLLMFLWMAITVLGSTWNAAGVQRSQIEAISAGLVWQVLTAALFVLLVARWLQWRDLGFVKTDGWAALRLVWLPSLYILLFGLGALLLGPPPLGFVLIVLINCLFVGFSKELMFRGVVFSAFARRRPIWPAILASSFLFGAIHSLNAFGTGHLFIALMQSVAAGLSGLFLLALRLRTGSLWPPIIFHWIWNFALLVAGGAAMKQVDVNAAAASAGMKEGLLAITFQLPIALYALYLLRHVHRARAEP